MFHKINTKNCCIHCKILFLIDISIHHLLSPLMHPTYVTLSTFADMCVCECLCVFVRASCAVKIENDHNHIEIVGVSGVYFDCLFRSLRLCIYLTHSCVSLPLSFSNRMYLSHSYFCSLRITIIISRLFV